MTVIVPMRAALGFAVAVLASSLAIEARAQDASPWQRDGHSAVRLLAGSRSGAVLLGGIAFQLAAGLEDLLADARRFRRSAALRLLQIGQYRGRDRSVAGADEIRRRRRRHSLGYHDQIVLPLRIVAKNADKPVTLRADINYAVCEKICIPVEASAELAFASVASTEDSALFAALDTVPKPANVGDPNPLTIRDVKREGKSTVLVDVVAPDAEDGQPVCRRPDARTGDCRFRNCSNTARPASSASPSNSTACRPAPTPMALRSN